MRILKLIMCVKFNHRASSNTLRVFVFIKKNQGPRDQGAKGPRELFINTLIMRRLRAQSSHQSHQRSEISHQHRDLTFSLLAEISELRGSEIRVVIIRESSDQSSRLKSQETKSSELESSELESSESSQISDETRKLETHTHSGSHRTLQFRRLRH